MPAITGVPSPFDGPGATGKSGKAQRCSRFFTGHRTVSRRTALAAVQGNATGNGPPAVGGSTFERGGTWPCKTVAARHIRRRGVQRSLLRFPGLHKWARPLRPRTQKLKSWLQVTEGTREGVARKKYRPQPLAALGGKWRFPAKFFFHRDVHRANHSTKQTEGTG